MFYIKLTILRKIAIIVGIPSVFLDAKTSIL